MSGMEPKNLKVCIYGAGAIGGYLGVCFARSGAEVSLIARGPHLAAIRANGLTLVSEKGGRETVKLKATDKPQELGPQDFVVVALKAHQVGDTVDAMRSLLKPETAILCAYNGVPYWYFHKHGGPFDGRQIECVDPGGKQWKVLGPERGIGCVVYPAAEAGVIHHEYGDKFPIGEPSGQSTPRAQALSKLFEASGLRAPVLDKIRDEIWLKLWGNVSLNPISALTLATLDVICSEPGTRNVARMMMTEAKDIAEKLGVSFRVGIERRLDGARDVGAHKTSMLQDLERGRTMEIDALVTVVQEMGRMVGVPTPTIDTVLALTQQRARLAGLYTPAAQPAQGAAAQ
jgi:2-dehydropantoate 2-reductase